MRGPYPIVCRAHSGGRMVCEAFIRNNIQMGIVKPKTKDTSSFAVRKNSYVMKIIENSFDYSTLPEKERKKLQGLMKKCVWNYIQNEIEDPKQPFGWKFAETLFTVPVLIDVFPTAKVVHLIRDGRDVMLSRVRARFEQKFHESFNKLIVFGDKGRNEFMGEPLRKETIRKYRTELEMLHWVTAVEFGIQFRKYQNQYIEVKYEDICFDPVGEFERIFSFLKVPFRPEVKKWLRDNVDASRIGKWKKLDPDKIETAQVLGREMLTELDYI